MATQAPSRAAQSTPSATYAAVAARQPAPAAAARPQATAHTAPNAQSSIRSNAPSQPQKGFFRRCLDGIIWFITGCGFISYKSKTAQGPQSASNASAAQTRPSSSAAVATAPAAGSAAAPVARPAAASAWALRLEPVRQRIDTFSQQVSSLARETSLEKGYNARELRWQIQAFKEQMRLSGTDDLSLLARLETLDFQLCQIAGMAGQGTLDLSEIPMVTTLHSVDGNRNLFSEDDEDQVIERAEDLRAGQLFTAMAALDPQDPSHLPIRARIQRCMSQMDELIGNSDRVKVVSFDYAEATLQDIEQRAETFAELDVEARIVLINSVRMNVMAMQRIVHPSDASHQPLRAILERINTHVTNAQGAISITARANEAITAAQDLLAGPASAAENFHAARELRWRLHAIRAGLNSTDATDRRLMTRIGELDARLKRTVTVEGHNPVRTSFIRAKLFELENRIDSFSSIYQPHEYEEEAGKIKDRELFMFSEALDPSEPEHLPLWQQSLRLYRKLDILNDNTERPQWLELEFAHSIITDMAARAERVELLQSASTCDNVKREIKDTLNVLERSIHPTESYFNEVREAFQQLRAALDLDPEAT